MATNQTIAPFSNPLLRPATAAVRAAIQPPMAKTASARPLTVMPLARSSAARAPARVVAGRRTSQSTPSGGLTREVIRSITFARIADH